MLSKKQFAQALRIIHTENKTLKPWQLRQITDAELIRYGDVVCECHKESWDAAKRECNSVEEFIARWNSATDAKVN